MTALTATPIRIDVPARSRHLVSLPTGDAVVARPIPRTRLTRRGRPAIATSVLAAASIAGASFALAGPAAAPQQITVEPGQTLSQIASSELVGVPTAEAVADIQVANGLSTTYIHAGQTLTIPTR
ncbi:LysM peptidoglycan-binding domain-containing protein [Janibacter limosus]|uniref:LysM peptidoglycan-binding domain-containing protein n=1 Tax=Janibacter limosus TaxID=53458 RepID=UPI0035D879FD|nr:LysM peptidoglycan-binding domain-containing protein [Janibacter limosus]